MLPFDVPSFSLLTLQAALCFTPEAALQPTLQSAPSSVPPRVCLQSCPVRAVLVVQAEQ